MTSICRHAALSLALAASAVAVGRTQAAGPALPPPERSVFHQDVSWSPDGERLAFSEYPEVEEYSSDKWGLHVLELATGVRRPVIGDAIWVSWSPDGERLAFGSGRGGNWDVYTVAVDGSDLRRLTEHPAKDHLPAWSPSGEHIAFCSDRAGNEDLYVMASDGSGLRRVTDDPAHDYNPAWSPDGQRLVFYREKGDGKDQIWVVDVDGGVEMGLTADNANNIFPGFAPDGDVVFASDAGEETVLVRVDGEGRHARRIGAFEAFFARVSPDGSRIAFIAGNWPTSAIYLMDADGGAIRKIVN